MLVIYDNGEEVLVCGENIENLMLKRFFSNDKRDINTYVRSVAKEHVVIKPKQQMYINLD